MFKFVDVYIKTISVFLSSLLLLSAVNAGAQECALSLFNSPKAFGLSVSVPSRANGCTQTFSLLSDNMGVFFSGNREFGVRFNYSQLYRIVSGEFSDVSAVLFAGPGASIGWVHDFEGAEVYDRNRGGMLSLSGTVGCRLDYGRRLGLAVSWTLEGGMHLRSDEKTGVPLLTFYKGGLTQAPWPQLSIIFVL